MAKTCDTCIHTKVCELWRLQECQDASCFFGDGCGLYREDAEPSKHGQWIAKKKNLTEGAAYMIPLTIRYFVCSLCGREEDNAEPYCNCGAKMDREPQEEADDGE